LVLVQFLRCATIKCISIAADLDAGSVSADGGDEDVENQCDPCLARGRRLLKEQTMSEEIGRFLPGALRIGVPEIDGQHAALFGRLVAMKERCLNDNGLALGDVEDLLEALHVHYATEEKLAHQINVDFAEHHACHEEMLLRVGKALKEAAEGKADAFGTLRYIEYWFERHIAQDDMVLGDTSGRVG